MENVSNLSLKPFFDGIHYRLEQEYWYEVNGYIIKVPKGFITDFASVPRAFWTIFPPFGRYTPSAVVHDFLYSQYNETGINRTLADRIFLCIMKELGVGIIKRNVMYRAVRMFGEMSWKSKLSNEGYRDTAIIDKTDEANIYYQAWYKQLGL